MAQKKITATFTVQTSYKGDKGEDGKNAVRVDLDNETDEMLFYNGKPWNEVLSTASLYDGPSKVTLAIGKWSVTYAVYDSSDATITSGNVPYASSGISIAAIYYTFINSVMTVHVNDIPTADNKEPALLVVTFTATYGGSTYSAGLRVRPSLDGRRYNIVSQPAQLTYNKTTGAKNATKVLVKVMKSEIKQTSAVGQGGFMHALDTGQVLKYRADDTNEWTDLTWSTSKEGAEFTPDFTKTGYYVWLGTNDVMDDQEHIPILGVSDGDGAPSATVSPGSIVVKCNSSTGKVSAQVSKTLNFAMKVGNAAATITGITAVSLPTGVTVSGTSASSRNITIKTTATVSGLAAGISFTVTGTYGGKTFSATATLTIVASEKGEAGHTGRWYYFAGAYSGTPSDYKIEETQAPYVKIPNGEFWMLDNQGVEPGSLPYTATKGPADSSQSEWTKTTGSKFNYFIANAVFADSAYFGSFVINGDWLISQHGVILDAATSPGKHVIDDDSSWATGGPPGTISKANAYTYFDPDYPNGNRPGYINFVPNFAVDGKTGRTYQNSSDVAGILRAQMIFSRGRLVSGSSFTINPASDPNNFYYTTGVNLTITLPAPSSYDGLILRFLAICAPSSGQYGIRLYSSQKFLLRSAAASGSFSNVESSYAYINSYRVTSVISIAGRWWPLEGDISSKATYFFG